MHLPHWRAFAASTRFEALRPSASFFITPSRKATKFFQTISSNTQMANVFVVVLPATIIFAWVFFWFCEKPFMMKSTRSEKLPAFTPQPSAVGD